MAHKSTSQLGWPLTPTFDAARWAEAAYDVWQGSSLTAPELAARARRRLTALLDHVRGASPLYQALYAKLPSSARLQLTDLPPIDKRTLMDEFDRVVTQPGVTRAAVDRFISDPTRIGALLNGRYAVWSSSGTTGEPGVFVHDPGALAVYDALEAQRFRGLASTADLMRQLIEGDRYAMVAATGGHFAGIASVERVRRSLPWMSLVVKGCSLLQPLDQLVAELNAFAPTLLATYPTSAEMLAEEQSAGRLRLRLREIWTGGECLAPTVRERLQSIFKCRVRNSYGASEFLAIGWECKLGTLHVNSDWLMLEPVDRAGRPVEAGQQSHTVLLTNLANRIQPLIRYDLGDSVTVHTTPCDCKSPFPAVSIVGRRDDARGVPVAGGGTTAVVPLVLETVLEEEAHVHHFQVVQTAPRAVTVRLGNEGSNAGDSVRHALRRYFRSVGIGKIAVDISRQPPRPEPGSGKLRRVICAVDELHG
jgi:phenylacetate-CoA ligase